MLSAFQGELALIEAQARASEGRVLFSITAGRSDASGRLFTDRIDAMRSQGLDVSGIAIPRGSGFVMGLVNTLPWRAGAWAGLAKMDFEARLKAISDPATYRMLIDDAKGDQGIFARTPLPESPPVTPAVRVVSRY